MSATLTNIVEVKEVTIDGHKIKLIKLPKELCANPAYTTPEIFNKVLNRLQEQHDEHILVSKQLRGLIQDIELD